MQIAITNETGHRCEPETSPAGTGAVEGLPASSSGFGADLGVGKMTLRWCVGQGRTPAVEGTLRQAGS